MCVLLLIVYILLQLESHAYKQSYSARISPDESLSATGFLSCEIGVVFIICLNISFRFSVQQISSFPENRHAAIKFLFHRSIESHFSFIPIVGVEILRHNSDFFSRVAASQLGIPPETRVFVHQRHIYHMRSLSKQWT